MLVAIDAGRSATKVKTASCEFHFPSVISEARVRNMNEFRDGDMEMICKNQKIWVGDLAKREGDFARQAFQDSKAVTETLYLVLAGLWRAGAEGNVKLVTGLPYNRYTEEERAALRDMLKGRHFVTVNGQHRELYIEK